MLFNKVSYAKASFSAFKYNLTANRWEGDVNSYESTKNSEIFKYERDNSEQANSLYIINYRVGKSLIMMNGFFLSKAEIDSIFEEFENKMNS